MGAGQAHQMQPMRMARQNGPRASVAGQRQKLGPQVGRKADRMARRAIGGSSARDGSGVFGPNRETGLQVFGREFWQIGQKHQNRCPGGQGTEPGDQAGCHALRRIGHDDGRDGQTLKGRQPRRPVGRQGDGDPAAGGKGGARAAGEEGFAVNRFKQFVGPPHARGRTGGKD